MQRSIRLACVVSFTFAFAGCAATVGVDDNGEESVAVAKEALSQNLIPIADTTLRLGIPFGNDGTGTQLGITAASVADVNRSIVQFSQPSIKAIIPTGSVLYSARLDLAIVGISAGWLGGAVDIMPMNRTWAEGNGLLGHGASWVCADDTNTTLFGNLTNDCSSANNWSMLPTGPYPRPFSPTATDRQPIFTGGLGTISFDVTPDVQRYLNLAATNYGWMLAGAPNVIAGESVQFSSREGTRPPVIVIEYGPDLCPSDPNKGKPGQCGCGTADIDTNLDHVADCFDAVVSATGDTALRLAVPFGNDGTGLFLSATSVSIVDLERSLVKVDNAAISAARHGGPITKAYLEFTVAGIATGWAGGMLALHRMNPTPVWTEGTGLLGWGASWACANDVNTTLLGNATNDCALANLWDMSPIPIPPSTSPFATTPTATIGLTWPGMTSVRFDVTADVQQFIANPAQNNGWLLQGRASNFASGAWVTLASRESGAPPRLMLSLPKTCPTTGKPGGPGVCGCSIPETDTDTDGTPDCVDECPNDRLKTKSGVCGCGVAEVDTDGDKLYDCVDPCPRDNDPTLGGACGCPSSTVAPAGTACQGVCRGSGDPSGIDTCNGQGRCGNPSNRTTCPAPDPTCSSCKAFLAKGLSNSAQYSVYWFCPCNKSRDPASAACNSVPGGHLVQIQDDAQNSWVRSQISSDSWLGGNDKSVEGDWRWAWAGGDNGTRFWSGAASGTSHGEYQKWQSGEPGGGASDDCAAISFASATGEWQDRSCGQSLGFVCEAALETPDTNGVVPATDKTCALLGNNCLPNTKPCVNASTLPGGTPAAQYSQLLTCETCTSNPMNCPGAPNPTPAQQATCRATCSAQCTGAAMPPPATSTSTCDDSDAYALASAPSTIPLPEKHCPIQHPSSAVNLTVCKANSACAGQPGGNTQCGELFHCRECDPTQGTFCPECDGQRDPTQPLPPNYRGCSAHMVNGIDQNPCVADKYCGVNVPECFLNDNNTDLCTEYNLCIDPTQVFTPLPPANAAALEQPKYFDPATEFSIPATPPASVTFPDDFACSGSTCTAVKDATHPWCHYAVTEGLAPQAPPSLTKPVSTGSSSILSFNVDPGLDLTYKIGNGPLGLPLPLLSAQARLNASAAIRIFNMAATLDVIRLSASAAGGLNSDTANPANNVCGFNATAKATILGLDVLPSKVTLRKPDVDPTTHVDPQAKCLEALADFQKVVDSAHKAFADGRELVTQYNKLKALATPQYFSDGTAGVASLCEQIAKSPPRGFPNWGWDCKTEPPVITINRFIAFYNQYVVQQVRNQAQQLGAKLDGLVAPNFSTPLLKPIDEDDQITIWNTTFLIGPVPCNLEVLLTAQYKVDANILNEFRIGKLVGDLVASNTLDHDPIFKVGIDGGPAARAGLSLFAGVGFDIGFASAKLGIDGAIDLGEVRLPVNGWAGIGVAAEKDARTPPPSWNATVDTSSGSLIPTQRLVFSLNYGYGADLALSDVLSGSLGLRLKLKFFFFSVNYRKAIISFTGLCAPGPVGTPNRQGWCDIVLFKGGDQSKVNWGTIQLPMPFYPLKYLDWPKVPEVGTSAFDDSKIGKPFYDTLCQCIPDWNPSNPPKQDCFRREDCCSAGNPGITCFRDPTPVNGVLRSECTGCRTAGASGSVGLSCNNDGECCDPANNSCFFNQDPTSPDYLKGRCRAKTQICLALCARNADCQAGLECTGPSIQFPGALRCLQPGHPNCPVR